MKSPLEAPEKQIAEETSAKPEKREAAAVIDTSKMSKGKREALELAEASRDPLDERGSFASNLFIGRYDFDRIYPWPEQSADDREAGKEFLTNLEKYLRENVDADEVDRDKLAGKQHIRLRLYSVRHQHIAVGAANLYRPTLRRPQVRHFHNYVKGGDGTIAFLHSADDLLRGRLRAQISACAGARMLPGKSAASYQ